MRMHAEGRCATWCNAPCRRPRPPEPLFAAWLQVPEELFGPLSMRALEQDQYIRQTEG
jgi:hypothetical protein